MRTDLKITCQFNHFYYHNDNYEWTTEMPYFWFTFFKIDGSNCRLNDSLQLEGNATLYSGFNKIESLINLEHDKHDNLKIPLNLGLEEITIKLISVPEFVRINKIESLDSYIGCVAVLMNEECALNDEKNLYAKILNQTIQNSLNELIPYLTGNHSIDKNLYHLRNEIDSKLISESKKNQSFWKRFTTENIIETTIWTFSSDELKSLNSVSLSKYWGTQGLWELSGKIKIKEHQLNKNKKSEPKSRKKSNVIIH